MEEDTTQRCDLCRSETKSQKSDQIEENQRRTSMIILEEKEENNCRRQDDSTSSERSVDDFTFQRQRKRAVRRPLKEMEAAIDRDNLNLAKERIMINVGGVRHETYRSTLKMIPDTRLAWIAENKSSNFEGFDPLKNEYFFDRHPSVFAQILNYYRTGKLHSPSDVCGPLFEEELQFWGIDEKQMEPCCWAKYTEHRDAQENLKVFEDRDIAVEDEQTGNLSAYPSNEEASPREKSTTSSCFESFIRKIKPSYFETQRWRTLKRKGHNLLENHSSSLSAKVVTFLSLAFIILSILSVCFHSMLYYYYQEFDKQSKLDLPLYILDVICFVWFTLELFARFIVFYPRRVRFFLSLSNWIDIIAVCTYIPYFSQKALNDEYAEPIEILSSLRMLRLFRFFRLSSGLQILKHTMIASSKEMLLLLLLLMIPVTVFATIVYFCERKVTSTKFKTIPESFWWAIITMTTVGYGDMQPKTTLGKIFGAMCASCSLLILALPVSIIGNNFSLFYSYAQARLKLPKKSHNALVGAANVLVADTSNSDPSPTFDNDSDYEGMKHLDDTDDPSITAGKRYKRDRLSLYAGGVVRSSRRPLRIRSAGITGLTTGDDTEPGHLSAGSSNEANTEVEFQPERKNSNEGKESENGQNSSADEERKAAVDSHAKPNGCVPGKPPLSARRRPKSGTLKVHPIITLQVTEDVIDTKATDQGVDNDTFEGRLDVNDNNSQFYNGQRTPPVQELGIFSNNSTVINIASHDKAKENNQMQEYNSSALRNLNLSVDGHDMKQNGRTHLNLVNIGKKIDDGISLSNDRINAESEAPRDSLLSPTCNVNGLNSSQCTSNIALAL